MVVPVEAAGDGAFVSCLTAGDGGGVAADGSSTFMTFPPALPPAFFLPVSCLPGIHLRLMSSAMTVAAAVHAPTNKNRQIIPI